MRGKRCEVSASEMMEMRREGLSNADIAELLDISVATVRKYIGNQGKCMERLAAFAGKKQQPEAEEICETKKQMTKPKYVPSQELYRVGEFTICVDHDMNLIEVRNNCGAIRVSFEEAAQLLEFLAWAGREKCQREEDDNAEIY